MAAYTTIDDPEAHFQAKLYTGDGDANAQTFDGDNALQPDLCWGHHRDGTEGGGMWDSPRGVLKRINSHALSAESSQTDSLVSFDADGFTVGGTTANNDAINLDSGLFVMHCWKANGSGSSDTNGSINSTKTSANTTAGFSIVTYSGNATDEATVGHGLGTVPKFMMIKATGSTENWTVWHHTMTSIEYYMVLANNGAVADADGAILHALPTTTLFSLGSDSRNNGNTIANVAYIWSPIQGFSKFGTYTGTGNADGAFVHTGFRPAWIMVKNLEAGSWWIWDNKRLGYNVDNERIFADATTAEATSDYVDLVSNGFKFRNTDGDINKDAKPYIYAAFAEAPFVNSNGVPCNAR